MLNADDKVTACGKGIGKERILGVLDGVALTHDGYGQCGVSRIGFEFIVAPHRNINAHGPIAGLVKKIQGLMSDGEFAVCEIPTRNECAT
jgi:hypothetical protein